MLSVRIDKELEEKLKFLMERQKIVDKSAYIRKLLDEAIEEDLLDFLSKEIEKKHISIWKAAELAKMGEVLTNSQIGGRRNIIINGAMQVAQRGTSFNYTTTDAYSLDRFRIDVTGGDNSAGAFTLTQADVTDLPGSAQWNKFPEH